MVIGGGVRRPFTQRWFVLGRGQELIRLADPVVVSTKLGEGARNIVVTGKGSGQGRQAILLRSSCESSCCRRNIGLALALTLQAFADAIRCSHVAAILPTQSNKTLATIRPSSLG